MYFYTVLSNVLNYVNGTLNKVLSVAILSAIVNYVSRVACLLSRYERHIPVKINFVVILLMEEEDFIQQKKILRVAVNS